MKVLELIERLREFDPQLEVQIITMGDLALDVTDIEEDDGFVVIEAE
jgi:hypothetical protein